MPRTRREILLFLQVLRRYSSYIRCQGQVHRWDRIGEGMCAKHYESPAVVSILIVGSREQRTQKRLAGYVVNLTQSIPARSIKKVTEEK